MLAKANRITRAADYRRLSRRGKRTALSFAVLSVSTENHHSPTRFGFIVSRTVGGAVVRNRVRRRMKAAAFQFIEGNPKGYEVIVRALPASVNVSVSEFAAAFRECVT